MRAIELAKKAIEIQDSSGPHRVKTYGSLKPEARCLLLG